jgi:hypothetical protein
MIKPLGYGFYEEHVEFSHLYDNHDDSNINKFLSLLSKAPIKFKEVIDKHLLERPTIFRPEYKDGMLVEVIFEGN